MLAVNRHEELKGEHTESPHCNGGFLQAEYLTQSQLAAELGRSVRTLDRWALTGNGPPRTRIGRLTLYRRGGVIDWLKNLETMPGAR